MNEDQATTIALQALAFIASDAEVLGNFLAQSGLGPEDLKKRMDNPDLQGAVLDLILADDRVLLGFCNANDLTPEIVIHARQALPGGLEVYE